MYTWLDLIGIPGAEVSVMRGRWIVALPITCLNACSTSQGTLRPSNPIRPLPVNCQESGATEWGKFWSSCPPSPNSCKLICLLNKEICVNIFSSCPHQNCWSNYHFHHFSWNKSTSNTVYTLQCQNRLTWTCFWRAVLDFADCSITVFPAIGWCRIWTIPSAMSGSVLTADTAWAPVWPLCPLSIYSCTNDKGRQKWVSFLANKSRNINAVPTVQKFGRRGVK